MRIWIVIILLMQSLMIPSARAQESGSSVKRSAAIVLFAGLGGAVLGLSTLSFYGAPEKHTGNITTGALIGVVAGVSYIAMDKTSYYSAGNHFESDQKSKRGFGEDQASSSVIDISFNF